MKPGEIEMNDKKSVKWSGVTQILPPEQISYLDVPVTKIIELTKNYGHGVGEILTAKDPAAGP